MSAAAPGTLSSVIAPAAASARPAFARVEIIDDPAQALGVWRELSPETHGSFYQSEAFLLPWLAQPAARRKMQPFFIVARDEAGAPLALLPLGLFSFGPLRVAQFLGGKHANYNLGLFRGDRAFSTHDLRALLRAAANSAPRGPHLYRFINLPLTWRAAANPLARLDCRPAASRAYATALMGDGEALLAARLAADKRKDLRRKERLLAAKGSVRHVRASSPQEAAAILETFFAHRSGAALAPDEPTKAFYEALAAGAGDSSSVEFHALTLGGRIVATLCAGLCGGRLQGMFMSYDPDPEIARASPGELLLRHVLLDACARRLAAFDLGVGDARYKTTFCDEAEPLAEAFEATGALGRLAKPFLILALGAKTRIKNNPRLFALLRKRRRR
jgi:CelD/BcsL family acetyltransferase involved in cellulose biosynthesis